MRRARIAIAASVAVILLGLGAFTASHQLRHSTERQAALVELAELRSEIEGLVRQKEQATGRLASLRREIQVRCELDSPEQGLTDAGPAFSRLDRESAADARLIVAVWACQQNDEATLELMRPWLDPVRQRRLADLCAREGSNGEHRQ